MYRLSVRDLYVIIRLFKTVFLAAVRETLTLASTELGLALCVRPHACALFLSAPWRVCAQAR